MSKVPTIKFNNGQIFPMFGLGTWKSKPGEVTQAVKDAIDTGYRHIDCAHLYGNEKEVGEAIKKKISEGVVRREDLYITSKEGDDLYPVGPDGNTLFSDVDIVDTWVAMEKVCKKGLTKSVGISNFNKRQIERILKKATIIPATNQIECHPYLNQKKLIEFCRSKGIAITAYSPLGSPDRPWAKPDDPKLVEDAKIQQIASKYNKTPAQVIIKYQVQRGNITIPKSVNKSRIKENFDIWDFQLTPEDIAYIDTFDCNGRVCNFVEALGHPNHPFTHDDY
ncbi:Aldo ket red domain containing protein [Asbolus verrucosus]|uniref:Aldo ket red domain containing protein n=1 Tax=Asbolus verrucosus TaxID=1661398 RepID=A0A482VSH4_ASBVE|nr:Aldo ket red domain containing protein [Asbolus verrucosus]